MLAEYASNPKANWKAKDTAIYLVLALTVQGKTGERRLQSPLISSHEHKPLRGIISLTTCINRA